MLSTCVPMRQLQNWRGFRIIRSWEAGLDTLGPTLNTREVTERLNSAGITTKLESVPDMARAGVFPRAIKGSNNAWAIPASDVDAYIRNYKRTASRRKVGWGIALVAASALVGVATVLSGVKDARDWLTGANDSDGPTAASSTQDVSLEYQFTKVRWPEAIGEPCITDSGGRDETWWTADFVIALDITNRSDSLAHLTKVQVEDRLDVEMPSELGKEYVWLYYFKNSEEVHAWWEAKPGPSDSEFLATIPQSKATGVPITIEPHGLTRLLLLGRSHITFESSLNAQQIHDAVRSSGDWLANLHMTLNDNTDRILRFNAPKPYSEWEPSRVRVKDLTRCNYGT